MLSAPLSSPASQVSTSGPRRLVPRTPIGHPSGIAARSRRSPPLRALLGLAGVVVAFSLYRVMIVPILEPPLPRPLVHLHGAAADPTTNATSQFQHLLIPLFSGTSWERTDAKLIKTDEALLLFQRYEVLEGGQLKLSPCTLVLNPEPSGPAAATRGKEPTNSRTLVLKAPEGAEVQFDSPVSVGQGQLGKLKGGRLLGEIVIQDAERMAGGLEGIEITTRNVQLNPKQLWTLHDVNFRIGKSYGSGSDLTIHLLPKAVENRSAASPLNASFSGVRSIELLHLAQLQMDIPAKSNPAQSNNEAPPGQGGSEAVRLDVRCQGPLQVDMVRRQATLEEQVSVHRLYPRGESDQLNCELLTLHFATAKQGKLTSESGPATSARPASTLNPPVPTKVGNFQLTRFVAVGQPVTIWSRQHQTHVRGEMLDYDLITGTLRLQSNGSGSFRVRPQDGEAQGLSASWTEGLEVQPKDGQQWVSLRGDAQLEMPGTGVIRGDKIEAWLVPGPASGERSSAAKSTPNLQPRRLTADGAVEFQSPQLTGQTQHLDIELLGDTSLVRSPSRTGMSGETHTTPPSGISPAVMSDGPARPPSGPGQPAAAELASYDLRGDSIRAVLRPLADQMQIERAMVTGDARLLQRAGSSQQPPIHLSGELFQLDQMTSTQGRVLIAGQPAHVDAQGMQLEGARIRLDRDRNLLWIDGEGQAVFPIKSLSPSSAPSAAIPTTVHWLERMQFDGSTIRCLGGVEAHNELSRLRCPTLEAHLDRTVNMAAERSTHSSSAPPKISRLVAGGQVDIVNRTKDDVGVASQDQLRVQDLSLDQLSGKIQATGPGRILSVRKGTPRQLSTSGQPSAAPSATPGAGLSYLEVEFQQGLSGNMDQRILTVRDTVRAAYGPVARWDERISLQEAPGENVILLNCDEMTVMGSGAGSSLPGLPKSPARTQIDLEARGHAFVEGHLFTATADRVSYSQSKDQLVLDGEGRNEVELTHQARLGAPRSTQRAGKLMFAPQRNAVQIGDATQTQIDLGGQRFSPR